MGRGWRFHARTILKATGGLSQDWRICWKIQTVSTPVRTDHNRQQLTLYHPSCIYACTFVNNHFRERCVYCTGTGIELQLPEVPATVLQRVKGSYRYRYHCTVSYSTGDHFQLVLCCSRSKVKSALGNFW